MKQFQLSLVWFRRDLRNVDHAALAQSERVACVFVFDRSILDDLPPTDRRVAFNHACVQELATALHAQGGQLLVRHAEAEAEIVHLVQQLGADALFFNHDYEPKAMQRDRQVTLALQQAGCQVCSFKDQVIFEKDDILTQAGTPFSVFTPYKNAWLRQLEREGGPSYLSVHLRFGTISIRQLVQHAWQTATGPSASVCWPN